ncbi:hypothetical protein SDC9_75099 [bioreactor metagenome]|uniref:Uncharacterized protein n=1 Tax=bioreactor metagenome TaxID=1076179 RepID=A0A644YQ14_9ZZZZ
MGEEMIYKILTHLEAMNERLHSLENDISGIRDSQVRLETEVTAVRSGQGNLDKDIAAVKASQLKLENNLTAKVEVLFDGWQQHEDYAVRNTSQLDRLEAKLDNLAITTARMHAIQDHHTELLNILTTRSVNNETEILALKRAK